MASVTRARRDVEHSALRALARSGSAAEAIHEILSGMGTALEWDYGALWMVDEERNELVCAEVWHRDGNKQFERFAELCKEMTFTKGVGLPGRLWEQNQPVWIPDVTTEDNFPRTAPAVEAGIRGAFAFPIPIHDRFAGMIEFFSSAVQQPDPELLDVVRTIGRQIGDRFDAEHLEKELVFQKALLESQGEAALDGILLVSADQRVMYWNHRLIEMWGVPEEALERGDPFEVNEYMAEKAADPRVFQELATAIRADPTLTRRDQITLTDGRCLDRWTAPVRTPDGARIGRTVFYRDITREKTFERQLQENNERTAFIAEASTLLAESLDVVTIVDRLANLAVPRIADWCSIHLVDDRGIPQQMAVAHTDPSKIALARDLQERYPPDPRADTGVYGVVRSMSPLLMTEIPEKLLLEGAQDEEHLALIRSLGLRSAMIVPLVCRGRALGAITFVAAESDRRYTEGDLTLAVELASRAAYPIDNARLYNETRVVAQTLQKSFLPPDLPDIPGVDISARYYPAGEGAQIGGDFYDAFRVDSKRWGLALGDVSGKGLEAATVTTLARHTIRGAALTADRPSDALRVLNSALIEQKQTDRFCTAVYSTVEPRFARVRVIVSSGGHPPPYVIRNDGTVETVDCGGTLLGFLDDVALRDEHIELEFGDKLFLYTDGVLDIRQKGGMFGPEGLEKLLTECAKRGTAAAAEHISTAISKLQDGRQTDDIAYILLGVRSSVFKVQGRRGRSEDEREPGS
jgi:serine phosphatase RsbU (regulator of sigma subunit)/PAS domain-containing protein